MTAVINPPKLDAEERFVLHGVSWETYEQILRDFEDRSAPRFTYDQGELEIMSPSQPHDEIGVILVHLIQIICEEREIDNRGIGSTTQKRKDLLRGVEPDGSFYIQNAEAILGIRQVDPTRDPPPDLVIEINLSSPPVAKIPIYAAMGVPEIWHFEDEKVRFLTLVDGNYREAEESVCLPRVFANDVTRLLDEFFKMRQLQWVRKARKWIRALDKANS